MNASIKNLAGSQKRNRGFVVETAAGSRSMMLQSGIETVPSFEVLGIQAGVAELVKGAAFDAVLECARVLQVQILSPAPLPVNPLHGF